MGSKTSKLKDQIAKGILSGMDTAGLRPPEDTQSIASLPSMTETVSDLPAPPESVSAMSALSQDSSVETKTSDASPPISTNRDILGMPESPSVCLGISESDLLRLFKTWLNHRVSVQERLWTGSGAKGLNKLKKIEGKIPEELVDEIRSLNGPVTHHLERAVRLYLMVLKAEDNPSNPESSPSSSADA